MYKAPVDWASEGELPLATKIATTLAGLLTGRISWRRFPGLVRSGTRALRKTVSRRGGRQVLAEDLQHRHEGAVHRWIAADPVRQRATFVLYADIELNIVDGSSVWLSSMASVLCGEGICILVSRSAVHSDIVLANVADRQNLIVLEPAALGLRDDVLTVEAGIGIVRALDALLPDVRRVVVRGLEAAHLLLGTRQFRERSVVYLTDFYSHTPEGVVSSDEQSKMVAVCAVQAGRVLVQTERIEERLRQIANSDFRTLRFPPVVPDTVAARQPSPVPSSALSIGYAGKIAPN